MKKRLNLAITVMLVVSLLLIGGCDNTSGNTPPANAGNVAGSSDGSSRSIGLTGVTNARELGGYPTLDGPTVKMGLLIRSGQLAGATEEDIRVLVEDYHLGTVIDLRGPITIQQAPNPVIEGVIAYTYDMAGQETEKMKELSAAAEPSEEAEENQGPKLTDIEFENYNLKLAAFFQAIGSDSVTYLGNQYKDNVSNEYGITALRGVFRSLLEAEEGESVLFHCSAGKDRTGVVAAIVLSALNVDREVIYQDYLLTNEFTADTIEQNLAAAAEETDDEYLLDQTRLLSMVDEAYLNIIFDMIDNEYGGIDAYLTDVIGLSEEDLLTLRAKYTE